MVTVNSTKDSINVYELPPAKSYVVKAQVTQENPCEQVATTNIIKPFKISSSPAYKNNEELHSLVNKTNRYISSLSDVLSPSKLELFQKQGIDIFNVDLSKIGDYISSNDINALQKVNSKLEKADLAMGSLSKFNLPINKSNVFRFHNAFEVFGKLKAASKDERVSVLSSVYKSGSTSLKTISAGLATKAPRKHVSISGEEIQSHLKNIGVGQSDNNIMISKDLLSAGIPITKKNIAFVSGDNSMLMDNNAFGEKIASNISSMKNPMDTEVPGLLESFSETNNEIIAQVSELSDEDIKNAVALEKTETLEEVVSVKGEEISITEVDEIKEIKLKRQIEEVRLKLTLENASKLEKMGIKYDTEKIEEVINHLRALEEEKSIEELKAFDKNIEPKEVKEVLKGIRVASKIKFLSGEMINLQTTDESEKVEIAPKLGKYLETPIRTDLKDSVVKTFAGIEKLLEHLEIEVTGTSIEATKALIRSGKEVTPISVKRVEVVNERLNFLSRRLTPVTLLKLTRAGIDIMDSELDELVSLTKLYENENSQQKMSRLIASTNTNESDYEEIIATYKAIHRGLKKDSRVVAMLLDNKATINLKNLKRYSSYNPSNNIDRVVGVNTGINENAIAKEETTVDERALLRLEKILINLRLERVVKSITGENIKETLAGSEEETLPLDKLALVLEDFALDKETFFEKNSALIKEVIDLKIPLTISNIVKAKELSKDKFTLIKEIEEVLSDMEDEQEKEKFVEKIKEAFKKDFSKKEDLEKILISLKETIDDREIVAKAKWQKPIKTANITTNMEDYFIQVPYYEEEKLKQLNIFSKAKEDDDKNGVDVILNLKTSNLGEKKIKVNIHDNRVSIFVDVEDEKEWNLFEKFEQEFKDSVKEAGFYFAGLSYSKLEEKVPFELPDEDSLLNIRV